MATKSSIAALIGATLASLAGTALAHHSGGSIDSSKSTTISGVVRTLEWENPHVWLWVNTIDAKGNVSIWGFEGAAPAEMERQGFNRHKLNRGDKITVTFHPLRDGRMGGAFMRIVGADGSVIAGTGVPGSTPSASGAK